MECEESGQVWSFVEAFGHIHLVNILTWHSERMCVKGKYKWEMDFNPVTTLYNTLNCTSVWLNNIATCNPI